MDSSDEVIWSLEASKSSCVEPGSSLLHVLEHPSLLMEVRCNASRVVDYLSQPDNIAMFAKILLLKCPGSRQLQSTTSSDSSDLLWIPQPGLIGIVADTNGNDKLVQVVTDLLDLDCEPILNGCLNSVDFWRTLLNPLYARLFVNVAAESDDDVENIIVYSENRPSPSPPEAPVQSPPVESKQIQPDQLFDFTSKNSLHIWLRILRFTSYKAGATNHAIRCIINDLHPPKHLLIQPDDFFVSLLLMYIHLDSVGEIIKSFVATDSRIDLKALVQGCIAILRLHLQDRIDQATVADNVADLLVQLQYMSFLRYEDYVRELMTGGEELLDMLASAEFDEASRPACLKLLISLVLKCDEFNFSRRNRVSSTITLTPVIAPADPEFDTSSDECLALPEVRKTTDTSSMMTVMSTELQDNCKTFLMKFCEHPFIQTMLDHLQKQAVVDAKSGKSHSENPVGSETLAYCQLLSHLSKISNDFTRNILSKFLPVCVDLFFAHRWASVLHNSIEAILINVLQTPEASLECLKTLVFKTPLVEKLAKTARHRYKIRNEASVKARRQRQTKYGNGYSLHAMNIAEDLAAADPPWVYEKLQECKYWDHVIAESRYINEIKRRDLGGPLPTIRLGGPLPTIHTDFDINLNLPCDTDSSSTSME